MIQPVPPTYYHEVQAEWASILRFWMTHAYDNKHGGFIGKMNGQNQVIEQADKGLVLNARILWTFAAAQHFIQQNPSASLLPPPEQQQVLATAQRAYTYLREFFRDQTHGGVYWALDYAGRPLNTRKQIYGLAFVLYGLSEYYQTTHEESALDWAIELFGQIEQHSFDAQHGGYFEAFTADWQALEDLRLSDKDRNDPKTMNTHLHIIEAYANLYRVWPDPALAQRIRYLLETFDKHIIDPNSGHMRLFFDEKWNPQSAAISYGHDIEASWLLYEAAEILGDTALKQHFGHTALQMAKATLEGLNPDGSLNHEFDPNTGHLDAHREWWVSAEGMVGYLNAYQLSNEPTYLTTSWNLWQFVNKYLIDHHQGEWFWGLHADLSVMHTDDKIGFWKCPYHNARACMEIIRRLA